jgi:hypothetical protein
MIPCILGTIIIKNLSLNFSNISFQASLMKNIYWKEFGLLAFVWMAFLVLQVTKVIVLTQSCTQR